MNHIYRSIWSDTLNTWIAVSELATGKSKNSRKMACNSFSYCTKIAKAILLPPLLTLSFSVYALPTGNELIAGQATVATPTATQMQIQQNSDRAVINWQGFSVGQNEAVNIQQPNAQAALLNRVVGQDASQIQGKIQANGQVYLVNPNGVMFSKTAQVDVGGLIATTHEISNQDFMNGKNHFTQNGATGKVENHGTINTPNGGLVALIGESVTNTGTINTPKGTTALVAGKTVDLDFKGDGLVEVKITEAALNAQIENHGAITANGGRVVMTAKAANNLIDTVINQNGIVKAQDLVERNGEIILDGGEQGAVKVTGTLNTDSQHTGGNIKVTGQTVNIQNNANITASGNTGGGNIILGNKQSTEQTDIQQNVKISAQTLKTGKAGNIEVLANLKTGKVNVAGQLDASAPNGGDGGFIDTSAATVNIADSASFNTQASNGITGTWLIDPTDFIIADATSTRNKTGAEIAAYLASTNLEIKTLNSGTGNGDIFVNDSIIWNTPNKLTLTAYRHININAPINADGGGSIKLRADSEGRSVGIVNFGMFGRVSVNNNGAVGIYYNPVSYTDTATKSDGSGNPYSSKVFLIGGSSKLTAYMLVNNVTQLQAMNSNLNGNYALGKNIIDASDTKNWNGGAGFKPIGSATNFFTGQLNGLGQTINNLTINRPLEDYVGLFGYIAPSGGGIQNVGMLGGSVTGHDNTGALVGFNLGALISNSYASTNVTGNNNVGGLVGYSVSGALATMITNSYATGNVSGDNAVGGLAGFNSHSEFNTSYATGNVSGNNSVGGLVGQLNEGVINNTYATGNVSGNSDVGGLIGQNAFATGASNKISNSYSTGNVTGNFAVGGLLGSSIDSCPGFCTAPTYSNNYWDITTSGQTTSATGTGLTTAQMRQQASFAGWDFTNIWKINNGVSYPTFRTVSTPSNTTILDPLNYPIQKATTPSTPTPPASIAADSEVQRQINTTPLLQLPVQPIIENNQNIVYPYQIHYPKPAENPPDANAPVSEDVVLVDGGVALPDSNYKLIDNSSKITVNSEMRFFGKIPRVAGMPLMYIGYAIDGYTEELLSNGNTKLTFPIYNTRPLYLTVQVFDSKGNLLNTEYVEPKLFQGTVSNTVDAIGSIFDGQTGVRDTTASTKTDISITVPAKGSVKISYSSEQAIRQNFISQAVSLLISSISVKSHSSVADRQLKNVLISIANDTLTTPIINDFINRLVASLKNNQLVR
jgi:filamentous hemagglutinin family protein